MQSTLAEYPHRCEKTRYGAKFCASPPLKIHSLGVGGCMLEEAYEIPAVGGFEIYTPTPLASKMPDGQKRGNGEGGVYTIQGKTPWAVSACAQCPVLLVSGVADARLPSFAHQPWSVPLD